MIFAKWAFPFSKTQSKAFSLIELLLVLFILVFVFAFVSKRFFRKEEKVRTAFDKLARLNRRLVLQSQMNNQTYRWVIDLKSDGPEQYWVEKQQIKSPQATEDEEKPSSGFVVDRRFFPEPEIITPLLDISRVESTLLEEAQTEGQVYIYYYPKGLAQETALHFYRPDNQAVWTLHLNPATKSLELFKGEKNISQ